MFVTGMNTVILFHGALMQDPSNPRASRYEGLVSAGTVPQVRVNLARP